MNLKLLAATGVAALGLMASSAFAAEVITITTAVGNNLPAGETLITDFNSVGGADISGPGSDQGGTIVDLAAGFTFTQDSGAYTRVGAAGLDPGVSAPPPNDNGFYETVLGGGSATLTSDAGLSQFSFYMGSPDSYNGLSFTFVGANGSQTLNGSQIWCQTPTSPACYGGGGDQSLGYTVTYTFAPDAVKQIQFTSSGNSFEFDTLGGITVPEPATWALMVMGFGAGGGLLRARRRKAALA